MTRATLGELRARDDTAHIQVLEHGYWWWLDDADHSDDTLIVEWRLMPCPTCGAKP